MFTVNGQPRRVARAKWLVAYMYLPTMIHQQRTGLPSWPAADVEKYLARMYGLHGRNGACFVCNSQRRLDVLVCVHAMYDACTGTYCPSLPHDGYSRSPVAILWVHCLRQRRQVDQTCWPGALNLSR